MKSSVVSGELTGAGFLEGLREFGSSLMSASGFGGSDDG
jgi:hypothetical protein